jgi:Rha family phage regulatory protein
MNDIVTVVNDTPMTTSLLIAEKFNKPHADLLKVIRKTISELPLSFSQGNFSESTFINDRGRAYPCFDMTRDAFSIIVMGLHGKEALKWKVKFINAFNSMEAALLKKQDAVEWKQARLQSKQIRKSVTDTIARFINYASEQGSKSSAMYYPNITKMEYKALELIAKNEKVCKNFRDTLDEMQLCFLSGAEQVAKAAIEQGMERRLHYKDIYQDAKAKVFSYADSVSFARIAKK